MYTALKVFVIFTFLLTFILFSLHLCLCILYRQCLQKAEESFGSPDMGVAVSCHRGARNWTWVFWKSTLEDCSQPLSHLSTSILTTAVCVCVCMCFRQGLTVFAYFGPLSAENKSMHHYIWHPFESLKTWCHRLCATRSCWLFIYIASSFVAVCFSFCLHVFTFVFDFSAVWLQGTQIHTFLYICPDYICALLSFLSERFYLSLQAFPLVCLLSLCTLYCLITSHSNDTFHLHTLLFHLKFFYCSLCVCVHVCGHYGKFWIWLHGKSDLFRMIHDSLHMHMQTCTYTSHTCTSTNMQNIYTPQTHKEITALSLIFYLESRIT